MQVGPEELAALAAAGGAAVVQAAGTDAWAGLRAWVSRWVGRGNEQREQTELERLEAAATALAAATDPQAAAAEAARQQGYWNGRFETLLEPLPPEEREQASTELKSLLARGTAASGVAPHVAVDTINGPVQIANQGSNYMVNNIGSRS